MSHRFRRGMFASASLHAKRSSFGTCAYCAIQDRLADRISIHAVCVVASLSCGDVDSCAALTETMLYHAYAWSTHRPDFPATSGRIRRDGAQQWKDWVLSCDLYLASGRDHRNADHRRG